jgi:D-arabinan exo alpha-(1,3)/(1,5)-arabinofuranosidase (non-reducing end)
MSSNKHPGYRVSASFGLLVLIGAGLSVPASPAVAASTDPYGLASMARLDDLSSLDPEVQTGMDSSYQRNGGYDDWNGSLYSRSVSGGTEQVYTDMNGPGEITRIWGTRFDGNDHIRVYFDGESTPRINALATTFFSGTYLPFRPPLVMPDTVSSGGFVSYVPLPFAQSVQVVLFQENGGTQDAYLQVNTRQFSAGTSVATWTNSESGSQDSGAVRDLWSNTGTDPKPSATETIKTGTVDAAASSAQTLWNISGPRSISKIRIKLPGITGPSRQITDRGRAFGVDGGVPSSSTFTLAIDPANTGVRMTRRLDYQVGNQRAAVTVDGTLINDWFDQGSMYPFINGGFAAFKNSSIDIPPALTAGKASITVKITFVSSDIDWNEFAYWAYSEVTGSYAQTDFLDIGTSTPELASEAAHSYTPVGAHGSFERTFYYQPDADVTTALNDLHLRIKWDGASDYAVDTTLGMFFGIGEHGYSLAPNSLMIGIDSSGWLYSYWPMPFQSSAEISLVNTGSAAQDGIQYSISHRAFSADFDTTGYFTTEYRQQSIPGGFGRDATLLDKAGTGSVVGMTLSFTGAPNTSPAEFVMPGYPTLNIVPGYATWVEGDEHVYIDGSKTPAYEGTGIEDSANGGFGWKNGYIALPTHGMSYYSVAPVTGGLQDSLSYSRLMLEDRINFTNHISYRLEHGFVDNEGIDDLTSLVYYYVKPTARTVVTDVVDVGNSASESAHSFATSGTVTSATDTHAFAGDYRDSLLTDDGRAATGWEQFTVAVAPSNAGVILRNRFDQRTPFQDAEVWVNGGDVGPWHAVGGNTDTAWKETQFIVPASFTSGSSSLAVRLVNASGTNVWNSYRFVVSTIETGAGAPVPKVGAVANLSNPDFETGDLTGWSVLSGTEFTNARVTTQSTQGSFPFNQHGSYHMFGFEQGGAGDSLVGAMRTRDFVLGGTGRVDFLASGGDDLVNEKVELVRSDATVLFTTTGHNFETYFRVVFDAIDFVGSTVYLRVTDSATGGWGHINIDDLHVSESTFSASVGDWAPVSGSWYDVAGGRKGSAPSGTDIFELSSATMTDCTIQADITIPVDSDVAGSGANTGAGALIARSNSAATQFYAANIDYSNQRVILWGPGVTLRVAPYTVVRGTAYHLKFSLIGTALKIYVNGSSTPIIDVPFDSTYSSGHVGMNDWNGESVFQNYVVS